MCSFDIILALLRNELWQEPLPPDMPLADFSEVIQLSREQCVSGLVANAVISNHLPIGDDMTMRVCGIQEMHQKKNEAMDEEVALFSEFLNKRGLKYYIMKGQTLSVFYPHPLMRSCGDIDFYCPPESYRQTQRIIEERLGITMIHDRSEIHDNFKIEGFDFEMHSALTRLSYPRHQRQWEMLVAEELNQYAPVMTLHGREISILPPTLNAVFVFAHLMEHFVEKVLSLKQLADWAMVLYACRDEIDRTRLEQYLERIGLKKAFRAMGAWIVQRLGFPRDVFPLELTESDFRWVTPLDEDMLYWIVRKREMQKKKRKSGLRHSMRTAGIVARQSFRFFSLAPLEMLWRIPDMASWSIRKRFSN